MAEIIFMVQLSHFFPYFDFTFFGVYMNTGIKYSWLILRKSVDFELQF